jgi:diadenosine tetraphosphatase ApaH/serine/threonine PP2A family protein phosphatase
VSYNAIDTEGWRGETLRALIVSDIHSNLEALEAVLGDAAARGGFDEIWCMGDIVGYGPDPGPCIDALHKHNYVSVVGNHDLAATGRLSTHDFNTHARLAAQWTATQLVPEHAEFLSGLPEIARRGDFTLVHGSLRSPVIEYLVSDEAASGTFRLLESRFCLVGHSHIPFICRERAGQGCDFEPFPEDLPLPLGPERLIINPGGVGQPRDGDPRPSYALYDENERTIERHRVSYDIEATQEKMRRAGLPDSLIRRLDFGV